MNTITTLSSGTYAQTPGIKIYSQYTYGGTHYIPLSVHIYLTAASNK